MTRLVFGILIAAILGGCGHHESESTFFQKSGEETRSEELTDPLEKMEAAIFDSNAFEILRLLEAGFEINQVLPKSGRTPLAEAVLKEKTGVIRLLLEQGASKDLAIIEGENIMDWVNHQADGRKHLIRALTKTEEDDRQELFGALADGRSELLKALFREGVSPNLFNEEGETAFTIAIEKKDMKALRVLIAERLLDVDLKNKKGESPLQLARRHNLKNVVDELVKRKAKE